MSGPEPSRNEELGHRHRRIWYGGLLVSALLHLLLLLVLFRDARTPLSPFSAAGPRAGDDRAAPAGGGMQALNLEIVQPQPEPEPVVPVPVPAPEVREEVEREPEPEVEPTVLGEQPGVGGNETGPEIGAGRTGGTGLGDGGTEDEGRFRVVPPNPRAIILAPGDPPRRARGREIAVWVFVNAQGRVLPDSTRVLPSTGDRRFDEQLTRRANEWVFDPARKGGEAVAEWFRYIITL